MDRKTSMGKGPGNGAIRRPGSSGMMQVLERHFGLHLRLFAAVNALLTIANVLTGPPWWAFWVLLVTGTAFTAHYLAYRVATVDDAWVDQRTDDVHDRSYDRGHIESIERRQKGPSPSD